ncbi:hypothetical protein AGMMS49965_20630 [Bacteroidia bacterium]|nr:hypothetical protein AGMMS49965_20630 [Bacteroidia bacterium]
MNKNIPFCALSTLMLSLVLPLFASPKAANVPDVDWKTFLAKQDLVFDSIAANYYAGAIMGNGLLGTNFYREKSRTAYRLDVGRTDVTEGRNALPDSVYQHGSILFDEARLPIGYFQLTPKGKIRSDAMRVNLYDGITTGKITTDKGEIRFKTYVHATQNAIVFETETSGKEYYEWQFVPLEAISPRLKAGRTDYGNDYLDHPNPPVKIEKNRIIQNLFSGKTYVVAWQESKNKNKQQIIATISYENSEQAASAMAEKTLNSAPVEASHKAWWHVYYPDGAFVTFPDKALEAFYWRQIYKFACASRPDKPIVDIQGPWAVETTPWPCIWHNLNTQLTYSWQYAANRSELSRPLWQAFEDHLDNLHANVPDPAWTDAIAIGRSSGYDLKRRLDPALADVNQYEVGNMTWLLYYYWQYCTYTGRVGELTTKFFPLLKSSINYYFHIRYADAEGVYHLPPTASPEYTGTNPGHDVNYDLALLRWGLQTLLNVNEKYDLKDAKQADWQDFLAHLTPYPTDENGYKISATMPFATSHRHYSHLLMIYPLYTVNWEQPAHRDIITRSLNHWQSLKGALQGYSFTGSAAMYASMGDGDKAVGQLRKLLKGYIQPNTLYKESGPVFETPMAGIASLHDLYLQSWGGTIRVFPALPSDWKEASFINLRAEGAFLVSAKRENGRTTFVQIISEAGGHCRVQTDAGIVEFETEPGQVITRKF